MLISPRFSSDTGLSNYHNFDEGLYFQGQRRNRPLSKFLHGFEKNARLRTKDWSLRTA